MTRTAIHRAVILLATAAVAAGCTASSAPRIIRRPGSAPPGSAVTAAERQVRCGVHQQQASTQLPAGFVAEAAVFCALAVRTGHGQGHSGYRKQEAGRGLAPLVAALLRRPAPPTPGVGCAVPAIPVPLLFLIDRAGKVVRPVIPDDACGQPDQQVWHALQRMPWNTPRAALGAR